ncbi:MAG: hypothetical protein ACR2IE_20510 [Candidatus Sumerlaeaceae bacterium]
MEAQYLDKATQILQFEFLAETEQNEKYLAPVTPETLHRLVTNRVSQLLKDDFSRLMSSLYQMDVDEELVSATFQLPSHEATASQIAELIIEREIRKVRSRSEHRFS